MIAGLPSSIQFPTIAMPCIRASWGGHESAVTSVSGKFFIVTFNPTYIREKRAGFAGINWLSSDAKLMTLYRWYLASMRPRHEPSVTV